MAYAIGIDLGTTNSVAAFCRDGTVEILRNPLGRTTTPSAVALDRESGALLCGRAAKDLWALAPGRGAVGFKRGMGRELTWTLGDGAFGAVELSAIFLRALKEDAAAALGGEVESCVVTVPAYFDEEQRYATVKAGELAGLEVLRVLNEPTAAAMAYGVHERHRDAKLLVFDLGGGTFDVCVMELFEGTLQVHSTAGESRLGGEDFTSALAGHLLKDVGSTFEQLEFRAPEAFALLSKRCELAKRALTDRDEVAVVMPAFDGGPAAPLSLTLSREEAERVWAPLLDRLVAPCRRALNDAHLVAGDLDEVLLVGGATRMPAVRRFAAGFFGRAPSTRIDPDLAVAHGAAIQAALSLQDAAVEDIVVTDVLSHSLGVDTAREIGSRFVDGYFSPVIHRNTMIPTSRTASYHTLHANQTTMLFGIYEGEGRRVRENRKIGAIEVKGIPRGPSGQQVDVRFTFDLNGILEVEATVAATGRSIAKVFHRESKALSEKELARARRRIEALKADPRDEPAHKALLLRAELLWQDLDGAMRHVLEEAIDLYEAALEGRNASEVDEARGRLADLCERLDGNEAW